MQDAGCEEELLSSRSNEVKKRQIYSHVLTEFQYTEFNMKSAKNKEVCMAFIHVLCVCAYVNFYICETCLTLQELVSLCK